jgi:hypothetical protein
MVRDKVGSFATAKSMQTELNNCIGNFVDANPETSSDATKARKPLAGAEVIVPTATQGSVLAMPSASPSGAPGAFVANRLNSPLEHPSPAGSQQ